MVRAGLLHATTPKRETTMTLQIGDIAPDFEANTTIGRIRFHEWVGSNWSVLFSHPKDFTPVCTTELGYTERLRPDFEKRGVKVIGLSVDSIGDHEKWADDIEQTQGARPRFPIIGDADRAVSNLYGMLHPKADSTFTVRSVFIIDPSKKVRAMITYPASTGRNFDEILRVIDSLQLTDKHKVATPVNWQPGQDVIIVPSLSNDDARKLFPNGWNEQRPYLRLTKQPA
jgi:alkyl hydroperoxide reductase subunit AhpC